MIKIQDESYLDDLKQLVNDQSQVNKEQDSLSINHGDIF